MRLLRLPTHRHFHRYLLAVAYLLLILPISHAYSVLSHEQVIDLVWKDNLQPMILHRFPAATEDDLKRAHAFAYGGSFLSGIGYLPFLNKHFNDLTHLVLSRGVVPNLLKAA